VIAKDDNVAVAADYPDRILKALTLCLGGELLGVFRADDTPPQPLHGRLEAETGPRARLIEERGHDLPLQEIGGLHFFHLFCSAEYLLQCRLIKLLSLDDALELFHVPS